MSEVTVTLSSATATSIDLYVGQQINSGSGAGIPAGGSVGQLIQKATSVDYETEWTSDISADSLNFSDGTNVPLAAGKLWYNGTTGSWNMGMGNGNITQQVGEEMFRYGKASAAIDDSLLQLIYKTGIVGASGEIQFAPAVAGITDHDQIIGFATEAIATNFWGRITTYGVVRNITTNGTAYGETWADNDDLYYNPVTGGLTKVMPIAPNIKMLVGTVIKAGNGGSGSFIVKLGTNKSIAGLSDVNVASLVNGDVLSWSATAGRWENSVITSTVVEGTGVLSTGETGGNKFLREDGDGTSSWQVITGGGDALTSGSLAQFAATTSAQLAGVISDETGTGALVFATSPNLITPSLGTPSSATLTNATGLPASGVVGTALVSSAIGTTVQGYSAVLSGTTASFTTADETKLDGIQAGANLYVLPFTNNSTNWDTAFGWGNHASAGYLTSETSHADVLVDSDIGVTVQAYNATYVVDADIGVNVQAYSSVLAGTTETFTTALKSNYDTAYGWGNHASAGYLTSVEGTAVLSTGEVGGSKFLREDGLGGASWAAISGGGDALTSNPLSQFAATTSFQLAGVMSDETGTGALVFATSPTLVTPALGTPTAITLTNATGLPAAGVTGTALVSAAIGTTVQGYSAVLAGTTESFTTALKSNYDTAFSWGNHASAGYLTTETSHTDVLVDGDIGVTVQAYDATYVVDADIGVSVQGYSAALAGTTASFTTADETKLDGIAAGANLYVLPFTDNSANWNTAYGWGDHAGLYSLSSHNHSGLYEPADATILKDSDIGVTVQAYNATYVVDADIGSTVQAQLVSGTNIKTINGASLLGAGNIVITGGGGSSGITYLVKTANYTAQDAEGILTDTSGGSFTITLPATPALGSQVVISDAGAAWGTNNLTVDRNGSTIADLAENLVCDITGASIQFVYDGTTWEVYAQIGVNSGAVVTLDGVQTLTNKTFDNSTFTNITETVYTITDAAAFELDPANGSIQIITLGANRTPAATNFASGQSMLLMIDDGTDFAITWTTAGIVWVGGTAPTLATAGYTLIELFKVGSTIYGATVGDVA